MIDNSPLRIVQITPGAGKMYCGACVRDNALVTALRQLGHAAIMTPLYLPLTLDEEDQSAGGQIFSAASMSISNNNRLFSATRPRGCIGSWPRPRC